MKQLKSALICVLILALCLLMLSACAAKRGTDAQQEQAPTPETQTPDETSEPTAPEDAAPDSADSDALPFDNVTIHVMYVNESGTGDVAAMQEAVNAITEAKLGVTVAFSYLGIGEYPTQLSLSITGGEPVDLAGVTPIMGATFSNITANGQAMALNDLLEEYGQDILEIAGEYMSAGSINGKIYTIPTMRQKAANLYYGYNRDLAAELGVTEAMEAAASFDDLLAVFDTVMAAKGGMYGVGGQRYVNGNNNVIWGDSSFSDMISYDNVGDSTKQIYIAEDGTAQALVYNEDYIKQLKMYADWYADGYLWPDTATNAEVFDSTLVGQGVIFGCFKGTEFGGENTASAQAGIPISLKYLAPGMVGTGTFTGFASFVPVTAEEPEAAVAFMNLMYTDAELMNTLIYGVEGVNYVLTETGEADYPAGTDSMTCGWHLGDFWFGNSFILHPWAGDGPLFRELAREDLEHSVESPLMGFTLDSAPLTDYIGALTAANEQYWYSVMSGLYTDDMMTEYISALEAAGLQDYCDAVNAQIDAWRAAQ